MSAGNEGIAAVIVCAALGMLGGMLIYYGRKGWKS